MPPRPLLPTSTWTDPINPPPLSVYPKKIQRLIRRLRTPEQVQKWIYSLKYNHGETMRTIYGVVRYNKAHCLEAVLATATILEYHSYPPLILDLESADLIDHTLFLYRHKGKYGTVAMSKDFGLHGRKPVYPNIRSLVQSYAAPYIDHKAAIKGYGVLDLRSLKRDDWRFSKKNVWYVEQALRDLPHRRFSVSKAYLQTWRRRYLTFKKQHKGKQPRFYPNQHNWA